MYCSGRDYDSQVKVLSKLNRIGELAQKNPNRPITDPVYKLMYNVEFLTVAYNNLKSKPGNMTPAINPDTLDGMSQEKLLSIAQRLRDESFKFQPQRRIRIPKLNGGSRPLTIASPMDKIVQEAARMILQAIFEPTFLDTSHGFRPGRSTHSALKQVDKNFKPIT
jgi:retron-type reverse transcriptase